MKRIFTLLMTVFAFVSSNAQAILNELYCFPGGSKNEFFEFYNNSNSITSMDNYTLVTYYESGSSKGFFVMDLPNLSVAPRGYFVGSSAIPFSYQGVTNSTASQFSWNDLAFMAANNGYLRQWQIGTSVSSTIDGNANYDLVPIPANYNDIFQKIGGGSATYDVFVYNNGVLADIFLGGTGGNTFIPNYIAGLPTLHVDMSGTSPDFDINFSTYATANTEYVIQDIGSDNGYIRTSDGYCGAWTKSSSQVTHTPDMTNGGDPSKLTPTVSVSAASVKGTASSGSTINYDVVSAPVTAFPVTMNLYVDNGSIPGQLDAGDTYLTSQTENTVTDGPFSTLFFPYDANILIQTMTSAGCIDNLKFIPTVGVLAVRFTGFYANISMGRTEIKWSVAENESANQFEIQKSADGKNFYTTALIFSTTKKGDENYFYKDAAPEGKTYYRIKMIDNAGKVSYSNILAVGTTMETSGNLTLNQNPVESYLAFQFKSSENSIATINIYNTSGLKVYSEKTNLTKDKNSVAINLDGKVFAGLYILEVETPYDHNSVKFIKH